jgi:hypothetical protein
MVDALLDDRRLRLGPCNNVPNTAGMRENAFCKHRGDLVAFRHDVVEQDSFFPGKRECLAQRLETRVESIAIGLSASTFMPRTDCAGQVLGLAPVVAGDDGDIAGPIRTESIQKNPDWHGTCIRQDVGSTGRAL